MEKRIIALHRSSEASKRLATVPGIGILGASAITTIVTDRKAFRSGRDFAAWVGLVPRQDSTGGKHKLGPISKADQARPRSGARCEANPGCILEFALIRVARTFRALIKPLHSRLHANRKPAPLAFLCQLPQGSGRRSEGRGGTIS
jgi:transposase